MRKNHTMTRSGVAASVAKSLRDFGYPDCSTAMVKACLDAWLDGKRGVTFPHGVIGMFAGRQFDEVEEANPGALASLKDE